LLTVLKMIDLQHDIFDAILSLQDLRQRRREMNVELIHIHASNFVIVARNLIAFSPKADHLKGHLPSRFSENWYNDDV